MLSRALAVKAGFTAAGHIRGLKFIEWTYKCHIFARYSLWRVSLMVGLESTTFSIESAQGESNIFQLGGTFVGFRSF